MLTNKNQRLDGTEYEYDISIVMAYYNRKDQTLKTLNGFNLYTERKIKFEVVIVDDNSDQDQQLDNEIIKYSFPIHLVRIDSKEKGDRINPSVVYNKGFSVAKGKIIIIQNPECFHVGNILSHVINNLGYQDYFTYSCFSGNDSNTTNELLSSKNIYQLINNKEFLSRNTRTDPLNWYNHPTINNTNYHFCSAIYKEKLDLIKGFDERFADGYCFDDNELVLTIQNNLRLNIKPIDSQHGFVVHQYHGRVSLDFNNVQDIKRNKWYKNQALFNNIKYNHLKYNFQYPKLLHLYWSGQLSYLSYLTVISFNKYNKDWKIIIYVPISKTEKMTWKGNEQKTKYTGKDYFPELLKINNVTIKKVSLDSIGFSDSASEVIKSDYFRYYILYEHGGLWSDFDIIYTRSVEEVFNGVDANSIIFRCQDKNQSIYYPIGLLLAKPRSNFYKYVIERCHEITNFNNYQALGANLLLKHFGKTNENLFKIDSSIKIYNHEYYLPWQWDEINDIITVKDYRLPNCNIGIHWFNGSHIMKNYQNTLDTRLNNFISNSYFESIIESYIKSK